VTPEQMVEVCEDLRSEFDFILIDSPAGIEQGFRNAIAPADEAVVVTTPEVSAVRDADRIIGLIEAAEKEPARLLINRLRPEMVEREDMLNIDDVLDILSIDLLGVVPEDEQIIIATNRGRPLALEDHARAGEAFSNIARRILGEDVPLMTIEKPSFFSRFRRLFAAS
jgi:septum site-determining protein MinD